MSTAASPSYSSTTTAVAPWRAAFLDHLQNNMDSPELVLSTIHPAPPDSPIPYIPHARYCIFRGMWTELPENKHNDAPKNERVFESDMPTITTDVRMEKISEIFGSAEGGNNQGGSGGGGPVEAVWWVKKAMMQWRMKGTAFVVGPDIEDTNAGYVVEKTKKEIGKRMRLIKPDAEADWSWQREVTGHFGNISPGMRGTFKQPPPGRPVDEPYNDKEEVMGEKVENLTDPVARKNFRVVIIRPDEVETLDLSDPDNSRRQRYTYDAKSDSWRTETTWP